MDRTGFCHFIPHPLISNLLIAKVSLNVFILLNRCILAVSNFYTNPFIRLTTMQQLNFKSQFSMKINKFENTNVYVL